MELAHSSNELVRLRRQECSSEMEGSWYLTETGSWYYADTCLLEQLQTVEGIWSFACFLGCLDCFGW